MTHTGSHKAVSQLEAVTEGWAPCYCRECESLQGRDLSCRFPESQIVVQAGRNSQESLPAQAGAPRAGCPGSCLVGFLLPLRRESPPCPGQPVLSHLHGKEVFPDVQLNSAVFQFVPIASAAVRTEERRRSEKKRLERPCWIASWLLQAQYSGFILLDFPVRQSPGKPVGVLIRGSQDPSSWLSMELTGFSDSQIAGALHNGET